MSMWNQGPMNPFNRQAGTFAPADPSLAGSPELVSFFNAVYGWMAAGLGLTAVVAWMVAHNIDAFRAVLGGGGFLFLAIAELALVWVIASAVQRIGASTATILFLVFSALNGVTLSGIFLIYAQATIVGAFLVSGVMFGAMSLYGMVTQRDLTRFGSLLFMCLLGLIVASFVNFFFASSGLYWLLVYGAVFLFTGLTAYDTQRLKYIALQLSGNGQVAARYSIVGALMLYLDFINLFLALVQLMGNNNRRK